VRGPTAGLDGTVKRKILPPAGIKLQSFSLKTVMEYTEENVITNQTGMQLNLIWSTAYTQAYSLHVTRVISNFRSIYDNTRVSMCC
jgi:hypothetical protein